jgi:hypothetical protein
MQPVNLMANIGTPFVWGGCFMLIFGNALIGYLEAWVLQRRYGIPIQRTRGILIATNFVTGLLGLFIVPSTLSFWQKLSEPLIFYYTVPFLILTWLATFGATVLAEWPMFQWAIRGSEKAPKPFKAAFLANLVSYVALFLVSLPVSNYSGAFLLKGRTMPFKMSRKPPEATLYSFSADNRSINVSSVSNCDKIDTLDVSAHVFKRYSMWDPVLIAKSPINKFHIIYEDSSKEPYQRILVKDLPIGESQVELLEGEIAGWKYPFCEPYHLRRFPVEDPPMFDILNMYWAGYSFDVKDKKSGESFSLAVETPFLSWNWSNQILLPDGWCVAEVNDRIWLIDLKTKEIAYLTHGHGATVILGSPKSQ